jgi:hypothetical protein
MRHSADENQFSGGALGVVFEISRDDVSQKTPISILSLCCAKRRALRRRIGA